MERACATAIPLTIFLGAFLLFQVQPLISKALLPWFGGAAAVWTTAVMFFQALLFLGYTYAHSSVHLLSPRWQRRVHLSLLAVALICLPIFPSESFKPQGDEDPAWLLLGVLAMTVGLPFLVLSSTAPLLHAWLSRVDPLRSSYRLYALSNAGALLALLSYPFVVEPMMPLRIQMWVWTVAYVVYAATSAYIAWVAGRSSSPSDADEPVEEQVADGARPSAVQVAMWVGLAACAVVLFMGVTNQLCLNVARVPFLWIVPLAVYLVTFMLTFGGSSWYRRGPFMVLCVLALLTMSLTVTGEFLSTRVPLFTQLAVSCVALFVVCMTCHGELYGQRPQERYLTLFYLSISFGGLLGGVTVGLIAPQVMDPYQELRVGLLAAAILLGVCYYRGRVGGRQRWAWSGAFVGIVGVGLAFSFEPDDANEVQEVRRNFYGTLTVETIGGQVKVLNHGTTQHGLQVMGEGNDHRPTGYYAPNTGVGIVMTYVQTSTGKRTIGVVGLGIGTLAAYGKPGDEFTFYEIDPDVADLAKTQFTYLERTRASYDVRIGDGRLTMERESPQGYKIIVLDAFTSDAVPTHLLTVEAFEAYARHLQDDGLMCVNISNRHLQLAPIVFNAARRLGLYAFGIANRQNADEMRLSSRWIVLSKSAGSGEPIARALEQGALKAKLALRESGEMQFFRPVVEQVERFGVWTDDYSSIASIVGRATSAESGLAVVPISAGDGR